MTGKKQVEGHIGWKGKLVLILLWINFVYLWFRVYRNTWAADYKDSIGYLTILMSSYAVLVTLWIFHNVRIYKKKGPRRATRLYTHAGTEDALRHPIGFQTDLTGTQEIVVEVIDGTKTFRGKPAPQ